MFEVILPDNQECIDQKMTLKLNQALQERQINEVDKLKKSKEKLKKPKSESPSQNGYNQSAPIVVMCL